MLKNGVLVVEDQAIVQIDIEASLRELSIYDVHSVSSVEEAMGLLSTQRVDLVISEWRLGDVSCEHVLARAHELNIRTIVATAFDTARQLTDNRAHTAFLSKPFGVEELQGAISRLFPAIA